MIGRVILGLLLALAGGGTWAADTASGPAVSTQVQPPAVLEAADEALLKERVLARWQVLIKRDFGAVYQFETPAYRTVYTLRQFLARYGAQVDWRMARIKEVHYDDRTVARVVVEVTSHYAEPGKNGNAQDLTQEVKEIWLYKDGQWWHQQA